MSYMKEISLLCENDDFDGLVEFLYDDGSNSMKTAMNMAVGFMVAHKKMRSRQIEFKNHMDGKDKAYKVLNNIHDKLQEEEE